MNQENDQLDAKMTAERKEYLTKLRHELRTPMTVIKGYLSMARDSKEGEVSEEVRQYILEAYKANEDALKMIEDIR